MPYKAMTGGVALRRRPASPTLKPMADDRYSVEDSRSVRSVWVWRAFLFMSLMAVGIAIILGTNGATMFAILWGVIAAGWFAISMWLWHQHNKLDL
jgi:hypothetical protein